MLQVRLSLSDFRLDALNNKDPGFDFLKLRLPEYPFPNFKQTSHSHSSISLSFP